MKAILRSLCKNLRNFLIAKSTCVTSGFMLNAAITLSVVNAVSKAGQYSSSTLPSVASDTPGVGAEHDLPAKQALFALLATLLIFSLVLLVSALLSRIVIGMQWIPERLRSTYAGGIAFIPAWQWKNVISFLMVACLGGTATSQSPYLVAVVVLAISVFTAVVQIFLEHWAALVDETSLAFQAFDGLRTSLGLGMGFAVNVLVYAILGSRMKQASIMAVYVSCLTVIVALLQYKLKPMLESKKESWPPLLIRALGFLLLANNFVVGWAWKGMIDLMLASFIKEGVLWQLFASSLITFVLTCVVVGVTLAAAPDAILATPRLASSAVGVISKLPGLEDLVILASAMNVGWTWSAFAMACLHWFEAKNNDGRALALFEVWLFTIVVVVIASMVAIVLGLLIQQVEPKEPEEEPLVT